MEFNLNERSDVEETASFSLQADFEAVIDRKRGSIEEKALRVSQQTQSLRQNKIWSKSKIRISSTPPSDPPLVPQFRYSNFQRDPRRNGLIPHWQHLKHREKRHPREEISNCQKSGRSTLSFDVEIWCHEPTFSEIGWVFPSGASQSCLWGSPPQGIPYVPGNPG